MSHSKDIGESGPGAGDQQDSDLLLIDLLYGELDGDDGGARVPAANKAVAESDPALSGDLAAFSDLRALFRELPEEEPPAAVTNKIMHAAAAEAASLKQAQKEESPSWWASLRGLFSGLAAHPGLAAAASLVLVGGVAGALYVSGNLRMAAPESAAPMLEAKADQAAPAGETAATAAPQAAAKSEAESVPAAATGLDLPAEQAGNQDPASIPDTVPATAAERRPESDFEKMHNAALGAEEQRQGEYGYRAQESADAPAEGGVGRVIGGVMRGAPIRDRDGDNDSDSAGLRAAEDSSRPQAKQPAPAKSVERSNRKRRSRLPSGGKSSLGSGGLYDDGNVGSGAQANKNQDGAADKASRDDLIDTRTGAGRGGASAAPAPEPPPPAQKKKPTQRRPGSSTDSASAPAPTKPAPRPRSASPPPAADSEAPAAGFAEPPSDEAPARAENEPTEDEQARNEKRSARVRTLYQQAQRAAAAGDCRTVRARGQAIRDLDLEFYRTRFTSARELRACLSEDSRPATKKK